MEIDRRPDTAEWALSDLAKASSIIPARVDEAVFSIETELLKPVEYHTSQSSVSPQGCLALLEPT